MTHCIPSVPYANKIPVAPVGSSLSTITDPGAGNRKAIVLFFHQSLAGSDLPTPFVVPTGSFGVGNIAYLATELQSAGFVFDYPVLPVDFSVNGTGYFGNLLSDVQADPGHGTGFVGTMAEWVDHKVTYYANLFGVANPPIIFAGFSLGGYLALKMSLTASPQSLNWNVKGVWAHCPATIWENVTVLSPSPVGTNFSGMDLSTTFLNSTTIPTTISWSYSDADVGFGLSSSPYYTAPGPVSNISSILTNASGNTNVSSTVAASSAISTTYAGSSTTLASLGSLLLTVGPPGNFAQAGTGTIVTGSGTASITYTGWTGTTLTGCTYSGSGISGASTVASGAAVLFGPNAAPIAYPNGHIFVGGGTTTTDSSHCTAFCTGLGLSATF
jgi:hypothetical protein